MFEIIMLFGFLYAATCQLFPENSATPRTPRNKSGQVGKRSINSLPPEIQKNESTRKTPVKSKGRIHCYAHAA